MGDSNWTISVCNRYTKQEKFKKKSIITSVRKKII